MISRESKPRSILVIDDDKGLCETLEDVFVDDNTAVLTANDGASGIEACRQGRIDVVLLDQNLPDGAGVELCPSILELNDQCKIIFMTAYPTFENAVSALKVGAADYLTKPFELEELELAVATAFRIAELERIEALHDRGRAIDVESVSIVGARGGLREPLRLARLAAASSAPVLITGETGTGKSLLAKHIHYAGERADRPFVSVNCAALPESLAESEIFGHEKGAFTGATDPRRGVFEMAGDGTVFLDEIGAMPLVLQSKLLGVLEDYSLRRIGGEVVRSIRARVIAATNLDLEAAVSDGRFRSDLYFRLGVLNLRVPPLRDRPEDFPELCAALLAKVAGSDAKLDNREIDRLARYSWPGNVRELRNILERAVLVQDRGHLAPSQLLSCGTRETESRARSERPPVRPLAEVERAAIIAALDHFDGNLTRTARELGIALSTLKRKVRAIRSESVDRPDSSRSI